jgi:hypothetical protein
MIAGCGLMLAVPAGAQERRSPAPPKPDPQVVARYQLAQMEGVLEAAAQHGARIVSRQWQAGMPQVTLMSGSARARGFRLDGYGVFFDVDVPAMRQSVMWSWRMLDQNNADTASALESLKNFARAVSDPAQKRQVEQAIRSLEVRVGPFPSVADAIRAGDAVKRDGQAAAVVTMPSPPAAIGPPPPAATVVAQGAGVPDEVGDLNAAYTDAVKDALVDAMLNYSRQLALGADEWLTIAARDASNPRVSGDDPADITTIFLRVKGSDLKALHEGRITPEEARKRVDVREY